MVMNVANADVKFFFRGDLPPKTNAQRQAAFRKRHPGYYQRLHAERRAARKARAAQHAAAAPVPAPVIMTIPVPTYRLALPAPAVDPALLALNALAAQLATARALHPIAQPARQSVDRSLAA